MFLCQVVPVAVIQLSALCRRKWCNSMSVWVWDTVTDDWSPCVVLVTDSDSQSKGTLHDIRVFVKTVSSFWQDVSPIPPQFLISNPLFTFVPEPSLDVITFHPSHLPFSFAIISYPFLLRVTFLSILHLVFIFIPYSSLLSLSPPLLHLLLQSVSWCCMRLLWLVCVKSTRMF